MANLALIGAPVSPVDTWTPTTITNPNQTIVTELGRLLTNFGSTCAPNNGPAPYYPSTRVESVASSLSFTTSILGNHITINNSKTNTNSNISSNNVVGTAL